MSHLQCKYLSNLIISTRNITRISSNYNDVKRQLYQLIIGDNENTPIVSVDIFAVLVSYVHHCNAWNLENFTQVVKLLWSASIYQVYCSKTDELQRGSDESLSQFMTQDRRDIIKLTIPFLRRCHILRQLMFQEHRNMDNIVEVPEPYDNVDNIVDALGISDVSVHLPVQIFRLWTTSQSIPKSFPISVPSFIRLPRSFQELIHHFMSLSCPSCETLPKLTGICLVCGRVCCIASRCCYENEQGECYRHSQNCGGVFLMPKSSYVLIIRQDRKSVWNSIYVDERGEDDPNLRRGKPLFLDQSRLGQLETMWIRQCYEDDPAISQATARDAVLV